MYNYCTLFDSNYLSRGLAMYESLKKHSKNFHLYIFAFDTRSYILLKKLNLALTTIIFFNEFEDDELLEVKKNRTQVEYFWTCTPSIVKHCIVNFNLENCTYLDADIYFFSDPNILIEEMGSKSILITEHRYTPEYDQSLIRGVYNVQFVTFKNDINGMKALNFWRNSCISWCYNRVENNKFGDQKYLDDWTVRFEGVHVLKNLGGGVAPWNIKQYKLEEKFFELIFYHFHDLKFLFNDKVDLGGYQLRKEDIKILYKPYLNHLKTIEKNILFCNDSNNYHGIVAKEKFNLKNLKKFLLRLYHRTYNIYDINYILGL
jgi:hypothetical protein